MRSVPASWRQSSSSVSCCRDGKDLYTCGLGGPLPDVKWRQQLRSSARCWTPGPTEYLAGRIRVPRRAPSGATAAPECCDRRQPRYLRIRHHLLEPDMPRPSLQREGLHATNSVDVCEAPQSRQVALREGRTVLCGAACSDGDDRIWVIGADAGLSALVEQSMTRLH